MRHLPILIIFALILSVPFISEISATTTQTENTDTIVSQQDDKVKVIITFKDKPKTTKENIFNAFGIAQKDPKDKIKEKITNNGHLKNEFQTTDSVSATITQGLLDELKTDPSIAYIEEDRPVHAFLDQSVPLINADDAWQQQMQDSGLTGKGTTVCIIDTGIDYTHQDLGNCSLWNLTGNVESYSEESLHPYTDNTTVEWTINRTGFTNIAVHFSYIGLELDFDYIQILYENDTLIEQYSVISNDIWSPSVSGDTIKVRLIADPYENNSGFVIDKILNGTATYNNWNNCPKVIGGWNFVGNHTNPIDDMGHGTHVAGIVAGSGAITGVAPDANLVAVKVLDKDGSGYNSDVIAGVDWCVSNSDEYNISVISMSLGELEVYYNSYCDGDYPSISNAINAAVEKNISVVIASGNDNPPGISSPACIENATRVGSTSKTDNIMSYTQRSVNFPDMLLAPGNAIYSSVPHSSLCTGNPSKELCDNSLYLSLGGTSMATPHVSGATAILVQAYKDRLGTRPTPDYIDTVLNLTGIPIFDSQTGLNFSRIDVLAAILFINTPPNIIDTYNNITGNNSQILTVNETDSILFNLTVSSPVNYTWKLNGTEVGANQPNWTFNTTYNDSGFWTIDVTVENDNGTRHTGWNMTINNLNRPPIITTISNVSMDIQNQITLNLSANISDPDNDTLTITTNDPENITVENHTLIFHYTQTITDKQIIITVNDSDLTATQIIYINITDFLINITDTYNNITGDNSSTLTINETDSVFFNISTDVPVNYTWYLNSTETGTNSKNYTLFTSFDDAGITNISVNVSNNYTFNIFTWTVEILNKNRPPTITTISNISMDIQNQTIINISANISDPDNDILTITTDDPENITIINHTLIFNYTETITNKQITITVNDSDLTTNFTVYINITDTTSPKITIDSPTNKTYNTTQINISIHADEYLDWCAYSLNAQPNITVNCTGTQNFTATENLNNLTVWANDTDGNINYTDVFFTVDTIFPNITITALNYTTDDYLYINLTVSETPDTCILNWQDENITMNKTGTTCDINKTSLSPGTYNYIIYVNDTIGNLNSTINLQTEIYYCFESVTDWSSCISSSRTRTHTNRDCTTYTASEICYSGSGGGGSFSYTPPIINEINTTFDNITLNATENVTETLNITSINITEQASNETLNNTEINGTQTDDNAGDTFNGSDKRGPSKITTQNIESKNLEDLNDDFLSLTLFDNLISEDGLISKIKDKLNIKTDNSSNNLTLFILIIVIIIVVITICGLYLNFSKKQHIVQKNTQQVISVISKDNSNINDSLTVINPYSQEIRSDLSQTTYLNNIDPNNNTDSPKDGYSHDIKYKESKR
ncbi:MAG: S8 family serine peptidase [DPANN group archaeon]|nr:S8 family serine peptidase [DPANN group archaeon]